MAVKKTGKAVIMARAQVNKSPSFAMYVLVTIKTGSFKGHLHRFGVSHWGKYDRKLIVCSAMHVVSLMRCL